MDIRKIEPRRSSSRYQLGRLCQLEVLRLVSIGAYLEWDNEDGILLPLRYLPEGLQVGDTIEVFVYHDNEGRLISTTLPPLAQVGEVALLECVAVSPAGAFVAWGIHKDLFVPFAEQQGRLEPGKHYLIYLYIDQISGKIVGSAKLGKHLGNTLPDYQVGDEVSILVAERNDVGYRAIIEQQHWGIIYYDSVQSELQRGAKLRAYVARIREDGRIDLSLRPIGYQRTEGDASRLLRLLRQHGGTLPIGDKSDAGEVLRLTGLSKKSFKMAVGRLYREQRLTPSPYSIKLND